jgi:uncharacterized integral membrane protein
VADPQHREVLDELDRLTVRAYRTGVVVLALGLLVMGLARLIGLGVIPGGDAVLTGVIAGGHIAVAVGTGLAVADLHLYDKRVRWFIGAVGVAGLVVRGIAAGGSGLLVSVFDHFGLGLIFMAISGIALKERFCFKIPGLAAVPWLLAGSLPLSLLGLDRLAGLVLALSGVVLVVLSVMKWLQPLDFDIGDKRRYQV